MHKYTCTNSNTQIQMHKYKYTNNDSYVLTRSRGGVLRGLPARRSSPEVETGEFFHHYLSPSLFTTTSRYRAQKGPRLRDFSIGQGQDIFGLQTLGCSAEFQYSFICLFLYYTPVPVIQIFLTSPSTCHLVLVHMKILHPLLDLIPR